MPLRSPTKPIPYSDLLGLGYSRDSMDPSASALSCTGAVLELLHRHGIPMASMPSLAPGSVEPAPGIAEGSHASQASPTTLQREATLAAWASSADSPWAVLEPEAAARPEVADVLLLLDSSGDPTGLAVVVDVAQRLAVTSVREHGVCALRIRVLRPRIQNVYRWRGAA